MEIGSANRQQQIADADHLYNTGRYAEAAEAFADLEEAFEYGEKQSEEYAIFCRGFGCALAETSSFKKAEHMFKTALPIFQALGLTNETALTYFNLGNVYRYINSGQRQYDSYQAALSAYREIENRGGEARIMLALANTMLDMRVPELAEEWLTNLRELDETVQDDALLSWSLYFARARLALINGDAAGALHHLSESLECLEGVEDTTYWDETKSWIFRTKALLGQVPTDQEFSEASSAFAASQHKRRQLAETVELAEISLNNGNLAKAEEFFDAALAIIDGSRGQLDPMERFHFMEMAASVAQKYCITLVANGRADKALEVSERGQGRSLLDLMFRHQIKRQGGRRIRVTNNGHVFLDSPGIDEIRSFCSDLDIQVLKVVSTADKLIVCFVDAGGQVEGWEASGARQPLERLLSLLSGRDSSGLDDTAENNIRAVSPAASLPWDDIEAALADLYRTMLPERLRNRLETTSGRLLIVPHRDFFHLPWSAFGPRGAPLGERWEIGVSLSIGVALQLDRRRDVQLWQGLRSFPIPAVAFGGVCEQTLEIPLFPSANAPRISTWFSSLPWTSPEVIKVAELTEGISMIGDQATPEMLRFFIGNTGIVHIASHGYWDELGDSFVLLSPSPESGSGKVSQTEVIDLVTRAELVALSGCQTGLGYSHPDTYVNLAISFLIAGARCVLVSLWPLRDDAAVTFASRFYGYLCDGLSPAAALQAVQADLSGLLDPLDYAGYVLVGNPFYPLSLIDGVKLAPGPAFCGGDLIVKHPTEGEVVDLTLYSDLIQNPEDGWLVDGPGLNIVRKIIREE